MYRYCCPVSRDAQLFLVRIIRKPSSGRNHKTAMQRKIRPKHSANRDSPPADGIVGLY